MKLIKDWKKHLRSYSFIGHAANLLTALSISGLSVLGVLSTNIALPLLIGLAILFGLFGALGRFVDQEIEDLEDK